MPAFAVPRGPVLDWSSFSGPRSTDVPGVDLAPHRLLTTSGRAALVQALVALDLPPRSKVLVPTYHCPTMIAPVPYTGHEPCFYGIDGEGLPRLDAIDADDARTARAIIVAHYFGVARSLARVREWCDARGIALIEDCAHCFFGQAGERPVGHWGDFATASLTKFFPVPEAGLLVSARRPIAPPALRSQGLRGELKGLLDAFEYAAAAGRLDGMRPLVAAAAALARRSRRDAATPPAPSAQSAGDLAGALAACDMARVDARPLAVARWLFRHAPRQAVVERRRRHARQLLDALAGLPGVRSIAPAELLARGAPYAVALWVDDAAGLYRALRAQGQPVFRWDRRWPATPTRTDDCGPQWQQHVLQFLCHQDLRADELAAVVATCRDALLGPGAA